MSRGSVLGVSVAVGTGVGVALHDWAVGIGVGAAIFAAMSLAGRRRR